MPDTFTASTSTLARSLGEGVVLGLFGERRPALELALPLAERVRVALMRSAGASVPWQISGKDRHGRPRVGHDHLYVLPFCSDGRAAGFDRVLLWARFGLAPETLAVVDRLARRGGWVCVGRKPQLRLELLGRGELPALGAWVPRALVGPARVWDSATAFVLPRHPKRRGGAWRETPAEQIERSCVQLLGCAPRSVELLGDGERRWSAAVRLRSKAMAQGGGLPAFGWRLVFAEAVSGPLVLGQFAHFGLGRFEARDESGSEDRIYASRDARWSHG